MFCYPVGFVVRENEEEEDEEKDEEVDEEEAEAEEETEEEEEEGLRRERTREAWLLDDLTSRVRVSIRLNRKRRRRCHSNSNNRGLNNGPRSRAFSGRQLYSRLVFYGRFMNAVFSLLLSCEKRKRRTARSL